MKLNYISSELIKTAEIHRLHTLGLVMISLTFISHAYATSERAHRNISQLTLLLSVS